MNGDIIIIIINELTNKNIKLALKINLKIKENMIAIINEIVPFITKLKYIAMNVFILFSF
jgi:hypothetical protein